MSLYEIREHADDQRVLLDYVHQNIGLPTFTS